MLIIIFMMVWLTGFSFFMSFVELILIMYFASILFFMQMNWGLVSWVGEFLGMDLLGFLLVELSLWVGILMFIASMNIIIFYEKMFKFYMMLMTFLLVSCFLVLNLIGFYLLFESVLIPIIMMIVGWGSQPERLQAGIYMLFYTLGGSLPLLIFLLSFSESMSIFYVGWKDFEISLLFFVMGVLGFLVKMPMFFVHLWLPKAHVEAPVAGSMVLAGVLLKLGIYGLFRVKVFIGEKMVEYSNWIMSIILFGGVFVGLICLCQVDIKALIAYSSVCHMGMALGGIFSMVLWGYLGNMMIMLGHGLCSSGLFCLANMFYERFYTRSMILLKGVSLLYPYFSLWWFLFMGINMAVPPSMNLGGEIMLIGSLISWSFLVIIPLGMMMFLSASYSVYMYSYLNHGKGWVMYGASFINFREIYLMLMHLLPLVLWVMKIEFFCLG
uniref:NADH dehydrogenase subunit 4 n=1 Tax=Alectorobius rioplatensis TaxID=487216 RepID=UPI0022371226|nr:NADH dehydrogenase subunit 4 [Alectorobius rioplatensis]UYB78595.1 NADH dehydrogenase subunit 4 [Alectorobius rioplatensis]UYB78608.1 NADH dehydrogenase subunit 4 [Alectorobius rioplatensis]